MSQYTLPIKVEAFDALRADARERRSTGTDKQRARRAEVTPAASIRTRIICMLAFALVATLTRTGAALDLGAARRGQLYFANRGERKKYIGDFELRSHATQGEMVVVTNHLPDRSVVILPILSRSGRGKQYSFSNRHHNQAESEGIIQFHQPGFEPGLGYGRPATLTVTHKRGSDGLLRKSKPSSARLFFRFHPAGVRQHGQLTPTLPDDLEEKVAPSPDDEFDKVSPNDLNPDEPGITVPDLSELEGSKEVP